MKQCYTDFMTALTTLSSALNGINADKENPQIKLLIMKLIGDMNVNSPEVLEGISWITFAVKHDDPTLSKLTAEIAGSNQTDEEEEEEIEAVEKEA